MTLKYVDRISTGDIWVLKCRQFSAWKNIKPYEIQNIYETAQWWHPTNVLTRILGEELTKPALPFGTVTGRGKSGRKAPSQHPSTPVFVPFVP